MTRNMTGFYHDPPLFLHEVPFESGVQRVLFERFTQRVIRCPLAHGLYMNATVQGLFGFDFSAVTETGLGATPVDDEFEAWAESVVARTNVMNAFLAFFYSRLISVDGRVVDRMIVTPDLTVPMDYIDRYSSVRTSNAHVSHLVSSGIHGTYLMGLPPSGDSRLVTRLQEPAVTSKCLEAAAADLALLVEKHGEEGVVILDLFLRAGPPRRFKTTITA